MVCREPMLDTSVEQPVTRFPSGAGGPSPSKEISFPVLRANGLDALGRRVVTPAGAGSPSPTKILPGSRGHAGMATPPRLRRSIFAKEDGQFNDMLVTLTGRKPSLSPNSSASTSMPASAEPPATATAGDNGEIQWVIRTHRVWVSRVAGQTLGMVVYAEKGKYGSRIDKVKPGGVAEAAGLRREDTFVKLGDEVVIHMDHQQLVERLLSLPPCFTADVCESTQLPRAKGRYSLEMWREADRRPSGELGTAVQQTQRHPHPHPHHRQASRVSHHAAAAAVAAAATTVATTAMYDPQPESPAQIRSSPTLWLGLLEDDEDELEHAIKGDLDD